MMEQLYYTWSQIGLGGITGFRIRAASDGLSDMDGERFHSFRPYLGYYLPKDMDPYQAETKNSPYCLAFVDTGKEHVALQKVFTGKDAYGRAGVYFIHLVASLPEKPAKPASLEKPLKLEDSSQARKKHPQDDDDEDLKAINSWGYTARDAIDLWMSDFWKTAVPDTSPLTLPLVSLELLQHEKGRLSEAQLDERSMPGIREDLKFVIQAFLSLKPDQKLYIAAPPQRVALLIWGLAHSLPRTLQVDGDQHLTFSTYEQDVTRASMRVIGTCRSTAEAQNSSTRLQSPLPAECFSGQGLALDCYMNNPNRRHSQLPLEPDLAQYAEDAVDRLVGGKKQELDAFLKQADRMKINTKKSFMSAFFIEKYLREKGDLTEDLVLGILENEYLAMVWLPNEKVPPCIIRRAAENPQWWQTTGEPALKELLRSAAFNQGLKDVLASFAERVANMVCEEMLADREMYSGPALKMLRTLADPSVDFTPWWHLLQRFSDRIAREPRLNPKHIFRPETRFYFLAFWAVRADVVNEDDIGHWLPVHWSEFEAFLSYQQKFPPRWAIITVYDLLLDSSEALPRNSKELMKKHRDIFEGALTLLMLQQHTQGAALRFYTALVNSSYKEKFSLLSTLLNVEGEVADLHGFLSAAQFSHKEGLLFLEQNSHALARHSIALKATQVTPWLRQMIIAYMERLVKSSWRDLENTTIFKTLWNLRYIPLPKDLHLPKDKVSLEVRIRQYNNMSLSLLPAMGRNLTIDEASLQEMAEAIWYFGAQNDDDYVRDFFFLLVKYPRDLKALRCIVQTLAPYFVEAKTDQGKYRDFLYHLAMSLGKNYARDYPLLPYIELAFEYTTRLSEEAKKSYLEPFLEGLLKKADEQTIDSIGSEIVFNRQLKGYIDLWNACRPRRRNMFQKIFSPGPAQPKTAPPTTETPGMPPRQPAPPPSREMDARAPAPTPPQQPSALQQPYNREANMRPPAPAQQPGVSQPYDTTYMDQPYPQTSSVLYGNMQQNQAPDSSVEERFSQYSPASEPVVPPSADEPHPLTSQAMPQTEITRVYDTPITREWLETVYTLKQLYISYRLDQLKHLIAEKKGSREDVTRHLDEQDELRYHTDQVYTLQVLQNDILIKRGIEEYSKLTPEAMPDIRERVLSVYEDMSKKGQRAYKQILAGHGEQDVQDMLAVFVRYRVLARYLSARGTLLKEWIADQRLRANVTPAQFILANENVSSTRDGSMR